MRWILYWLNRFVARLKGWRTIVLNLLAAVLPTQAAIAAIAPLLNLPEITAVMPDGWLPFYSLGVAVMNLWLRKITTTPIGQRADDA